ncbi:(deoxy)nucleoside triphosphate pyrophosphohydrolase [Paenibacillus aurantiacus]|uniref:8-oxo-dGTP diphosphatase n=1 Tax=Paenibacillus aurantiacus TaxID=1936118 RepID=A0ABV5KP30_9BACL
MKTIDVVGAVIVDELDRVLCAKRSARMSMPFLWEFPGGKIEEHEEPEVALIREIKEELNCQVEVGEQIADNIYSYPAINVRLITFFATVKEGQPTATEHEELRWVPRKELAKLDWAPADIPTVQALI